MIMFQILLLLRDPYKHLSYIILILWITRDQSLISISSLRVNRLFHVRWQLIPNNKNPTTESPHKLILLLQHSSISEIEQRFKAGTTSTINSTP